MDHNSKHGSGPGCQTAGHGHPTSTQGHPNASQGQQGGQNMQGSGLPGDHPTSKNPNLVAPVAEFYKKLDAQGGPPLYTLTYEQARQVLVKAQSTGVPKPDADITDIECPVGPTGKVPVRIIKPKGATGKLPVIFYTHGAGWVMGDASTHDRLVRQMAVGANAAVVYPVYTNSPEAQYPVPNQQSFAVLEHVVKEGDKHDLDTSRIVLSGDSVGGNMAIVMGMMAKEKGINQNIKGMLLFYPVTDSNFENGSYNQFPDGPWLTKKAMEWFWDAYCPDKSKRKEAHCCPLQASEEQLKGLPPTLIITDENDVLRDEGEAFARKLDKAGVETANVRVNGTTHDFVMLDGLGETAPTKTAMCLAIAALKKCLEK